MFLLTANQVSSSSASFLLNEGLLGVAGQCVVASEGNNGVGKLQIHQTFTDEQQSVEFPLSGNLSEQWQVSFVPFQGTKVLLISMIFYQLVQKGHLKIFTLPSFHMALFFLFR